MSLTPTRRMHLLISLLVALFLVGLLWRGIDLPATHPALAGLILTLFAANALWLSAAAVTALFGMFAIRREHTIQQAATTNDRCAILWLVCGEPAEPLARRIRALLHDLHTTDQAQDCTIYVLSDTQGKDLIEAERAALAPLAEHIHWRNRESTTDRKPGNLSDWFDRHGRDYETMLVLDADSGFSAARLQSMRARMASQPELGLIQAAIRLRPGSSRLAEMQRLSGRLCGPVFAHGLACLSGDAGNYWGHNALLRVAAFARVARLPVLSGHPPLGGPILSHDFIEAALIRAAGWHVQIDPVALGSFEDSPMSVAAHLQRDRRWAQGNLQHIRLIGRAGLHPASRLHLLAGIHSYLSAPIWLALVVLMGSGAVHANAEAVWALLGALGLLLVPKLAGLATMRRRLNRPAGKRLLWRALGAELWLTTLFAPINMIRRTGFVLALLAGRDSGWKPSGQFETRAGGGHAEQLTGFAVFAAVITPQMLIGTNTAVALSGAIVLPVVLPLLAAPWLIRWLDRPVKDDAIARYYDASTRRFLVVGGSGRALALHRPLWAPGINTPESAAAHANDLIASTATKALGRPPARVCDLGCGVGGSLFHLARLWPQAELSGITISAKQVILAREHAAHLRLSERCRFVHSDFTLPTSISRADLIFAIESHVHVDSAARFLDAALNHLTPGGVLIVVDDMLDREENGLTETERQLVTVFRRGWRLGHVSPRSTLLAEATALGFEMLAERDLTPLLRLDRLRDRILRVVAPLADRMGLTRYPFFANMVGGNALTQSYRAGIMQYGLVALRAPEDALVHDRGATAVRDAA